jgi:hypothetical protein
MTFETMSLLLVFKHTSSQGTRPCAASDKLAACLKLRVIEGAFTDHSTKLFLRLNICEGKVLIRDIVM